MAVPQFLTDLITLLLDIAVPAAICTMVLAGIALRREGGINFHVGGSFQRWVLWSVILLTLPQLLSWFAAQGITVPQQGGGVSSAWAASVETSFKGFVTNVVVAKLAPLLAAFCVLKAALDAAEGHSPLGSIIAAIFLLSASGTVTLMQSWNSGSQLAMTHADFGVELSGGNDSAGGSRSGDRRRHFELCPTSAFHVARGVGTKVS